jgi:putative nucleotidyltransferase with HDIG domain
MLSATIHPTANSAFPVVAAGRMTANRVIVICEDVRSSADIREFLNGPFSAELATYDRAASIDWNAFDAVIVDAWQKAAHDIGVVADLLAKLSHLHKPVFLSVGPSMRVLCARMGLLSGVNTFSRPLSTDGFTDVLALLLANAASYGLKRQRTREAFLTVPEHAEALVAADEALELIFALGARSGPLDMPVVDRSAGTIVESLAESGMGGWISGVRMHHDSTYQHCLLVTGAAIAFGHQLGFRRSDLRRVAVGALVHDIGKTRIPIGILDKPSALTPEEQQIIRRHPELGVELLANKNSVPREVRDIVLHHHEYLDGSGYPHGLQADGISDIVRLVTIADVFGALIEKRTYRPPLSGADAYEVLVSMDAKLDQPIVRAIRRTAFTAQG